MSKKTIILFSLGISFLIFTGLIINLKGRKTQSVSIKKVVLEEPRGVPSLTPALKEEEEKLIVDLSPRFDRKAVILTIDNLPAETKTVEYELVYDTDGLQRGVLGKIEIKNKEKNLAREILLGSCSKNVCVYDKNVTAVNLTLKIKNESGKIKIWQKEFLFSSAKTPGFAWG